MFTESGVNKETYEHYRKIEYNEYEERGDEEEVKNDGEREVHVQV